MFSCTRGGCPGAPSDSEAPTRRGKVEQASLFYVPPQHLRLASRLMRATGPRPHARPETEGIVAVATDHHYRAYTPAPLTSDEIERIRLNAERAGWPVEKFIKTAALTMMSNEHRAWIELANMKVFVGE
jgi:hypothetical protein